MEKDLMKDAGEASALLWKKTVDAVKKIPAKYKAFFGAGLITLFSQAANAAPKAPESSRDDANSEISAETGNKADFEKTVSFTEAANSMKVKAGGKYKGVNMKFAEMEAPDVGHLFESGMNPYIMGSNQYLGLYQMDIGGTMNTFLFGLKKKDKVVWPGVAKDYPKLAALGKTTEARRSKAFKTMFGDLSKTKDFRHKMDEYMRIVKYEPVYAALREIPGLDFDNRGEVFLATVMSAANQNPSPKVIAGIYGKALTRAKAEAGRQKRGVATADIIQKSYEVRKERWGLATRYKEECRLALDWLRFEEAMNSIKLARAKHEKKAAELRNAMKPLVPFAPVSSLAVAQKPHPQALKMPPQLIRAAKVKKGR